MCYFIDVVRIGVKELRQNVSKYLDQVKRGETVEVTERGTLIAVITSPSKEVMEFEYMVARGQLIAPKAQFHIPQNRRTADSEVASAEVLSDLREERFE